MKLNTLLNKVAQFEKLAQELNVDQVKSTIKTSLENIFREYPSIMDGFLYVSNVNIKADNLVGFVINLDSAKSDTLMKTKSQRDPIINSIVKDNLKKTFGSDLNISITERLV